MLEPGRDKTKTGRLWTYVRDGRPHCDTTPPAACYFFSLDRKRQHPKQHLAPSLFAGSEKGGERAAAILSLIETVKLNGLDPEAYLRDILTRIADHPIYTIGELLPWNTAANRI
ncbi:hypothetical protein FHT79_000396 [Rhizobium sp. BK212]|nr:hypothetical protein [Rhizobium sp. BK212]